jgi:hypothetical protein
MSKTHDKLLGCPFCGKQPDFTEKTESDCTKLEDEFYFIIKCNCEMEPGSYSE